MGIYDLQCQQNQIALRKQHGFLDVPIRIKYSSLLKYFLPYLVESKNGGKRYPTNIICCAFHDIGYIIVSSTTNETERSPRYSWNRAKVSIKHQSAAFFNQSELKEIKWK